MARDFNATGNLVSGAGTTRVTAAPLTLACWFNADNVTADHFLVGIQQDSGGGANHHFGLYAFGTSGADTVVALARTTASSFAESATSFSAGAWHHACGVFTSATSRAAFIDGGSKGTNATSRAPVGVDRYVHCIRNDGTFQLDGRIAEIAIWDVALTDDEVAALGRGFSPLLVRPASLIEYWPIIGRTSPEINLRSGGPTLTNTSGTVADHPRIIMPRRRTVLAKLPFAGAYSLAVGQGAYTISGQAVSTERNRLITAAQGTYSLTGQAVAFQRGKFVVAAQGSYTLTGQAALFPRNRVVAANQGAYALSGQAVNFLRGRVVAVAQGVYSLSGQVVAFPLGKGMTVAHGSYALTSDDQYTKVLLHFDGADGSTSILDSGVGGSPRTWTAAGNAQIDTAASKFGGGALLLDGAGDYVSTPDHADFNLGSGDFTIDGWFICTAATGSLRAIAGQGDDAVTWSNYSFILRRETSNLMSFRLSTGLGPTFVLGTTQFTDALNTGWHHIAAVRTGNVLKLFIDGVQEGGDVAHTAAVPDSTLALFVGQRSIGADPWQGWIDEFRLSVGIARWTTNFTPPTAAHGLEGVGLLQSHIVAAGQGAYGLSGQVVSLPRGRKVAVAHGTYALSGQAVALMRGKALAVGQGSYALSGQAISLLRGRLVAAAHGSYALAGQAVAFSRGRALAAGSGVYALSGQSVSLLRSRRLTSAHGTYALAGQDVVLVYAPVGSFIVVAGLGAYALTGQVVGFSRGRIIAAALGTYSLGGQAVSLKRGRRVGADQGAYTLTGQAISLQRARLVAVGHGVYALAGQSVALQDGPRVQAGVGTYALSGSDVSLRKTTSSLVAGTGTYALNGQTITLTHAALATFTLAAGGGVYALSGQGVGTYWIRASALDEAAASFVAPERIKVFAAPGRLRKFDI